MEHIRLFQKKIEVPKDADLSNVRIIHSEVFLDVIVPLREAGASRHE